MSTNLALLFVLLQWRAFVILLASNWEGGMRGRCQKLCIYLYMSRLAYIAARSLQGMHLSPVDSCRYPRVCNLSWLGIDPTDTDLDLQANIAAWHQTRGVFSPGNLNAQYQIAAHLALFILGGRYMHICDWYATFVHLVRDLRSSDMYTSQELPSQYNV